MVFQGKVSLRELQKDPVEVTANESEPWVREVLEYSAPAEPIVGVDSKTWAEKGKLQTHVRVEKVGAEYMVSGELQAQVMAPCSRCGDLFATPREAKFQVFMTQAAHAKKGEAALTDQYSDDPDYVFIETNEINVVGVLAEQLIVLEPVAECPNKKPDGSCTLCGQNPQFAGQAPENGAISAFSKLASLKGKL